MLDAPEKAAEHRGGSLRADIWCRAVVAGFIAVLCIPAIAIAMSAQFPTVLRTVIADPQTWPVQKEQLRRATPLWLNAGLVYGTALYRLGTSPNPANGVIGKDGYVFLGDFFERSFSQSIHRLSLGDAGADRWTETLDLQRQWLARREIPIVFIVAPTPSTIYVDKLPDWAKVDLGRPSTFDQILASNARKKLNLPLLDVRKPLAEARTKGETYSRTSTHWTDFGAWIAWQAAAEKLVEVVPGIEPFGVGDIEKTYEVVGPNEYSSIIGVGEDWKDWTLYTLRTPFRDMQVMSGANKPDGIISSGTLVNIQSLPRSTRLVSVAGKRALMLTDSMGTALFGLVQSTFQETFQYQIWSGALSRLPDLVKEHRPDVVLYVLTERSLIRPFGDIELWKRYLKDDALSAPKPSSG